MLQLCVFNPNSTVKWSSKTFFFPSVFCINNWALAALTFEYYFLDNNVFQNYSHQKDSITIGQALIIVWQRILSLLQESNDFLLARLGRSTQFLKATVAEQPSCFCQNNRADFHHGRQTPLLKIKKEIEFTPPTDCQKGRVLFSMPMKTGDI